MGKRFNAPNASTRQSLPVSPQVPLKKSGLPLLLSHHRVFGHPEARLVRARAKTI
jgi:hypothetical protein